MSKEKKGNIKKSPNNKFSQLSKENEIIEEIINNPLLLKDIEDLEEEEDEDSYSEKDKITEEILDNKLSFIISEENDQRDSKSNNNNLKSKIHRDIIENLLIDLFKYYYNEKSNEKKKILHNKIFDAKSNIEYFCNLNKSFAKYILLILDQKIYELIEYVEKSIDMEIKTAKDILEVTNSLKLTGNEIDKIFEKPFEKTMSFNTASILIVLYISDILSENKINFTDQEYEQIVQAESFDEKEKFEKYIEECKLILEKNGNDEDIEVYYEEEENESKENQELNELINNNDDINDYNEVEFEKERRDEIVINEIKDECESKKNIEEITENNIDNSNSEIKKDIAKNTKENIQNCNEISNNSIKEESNKKNNINNNDKNNKNNIEKYSNIEDLVKYINGNDNKKKKKKKRKKKSKVDQTKINEDKDNNIIDDVFENFKSNLIHFSDSLEKVKKIKPKISEAFIEKLKLIN